MRVQQGRSAGRKRRTARRGLAAAALVAATAACITVELPTLSHVHVGHAMTAWADTPGQRGLFDVALTEAAVAAEHAAYAVDGAPDSAAVKLHIGHVLHALDPSREATGPGGGYGLIKAIEGAADHLAYAHEVRDVSANLKVGLPPLVQSLRSMQREAQAIAALAIEARRAADRPQTLAFAQEVRQRSERLLTRLDQSRRELTMRLAAELPAYRTVEQRFLFGIIRLPSGEWAFDPRLVRQADRRP